MDTRLRLSESDAARQRAYCAESQADSGRGKSLPSIHDVPSHVRPVVRLSGHVGAPRDTDTAKYLAASTLVHGSLRLCDLEVGREHRIDTGAWPASSNGHDSMTHIITIGTFLWVASPNMECKTAT